MSSAGGMPWTWWSGGASCQSPMIRSALIKCHAEECNNQDVHHQSPATKSAGFIGMHLLLRWRTIALLNCIAATDFGVVQVLQALPAVTLGGDPLSGHIPKN